MLIRRRNAAVALQPPQGVVVMAIPSAEPERPKGGREQQDGRYAAPILMEIERYLRKHGITASRFGRLAASDPRLVADLRKGRDPSSRTVARIRSFMHEC